MITNRKLTLLGVLGPVGFLGAWLIGGLLDSGHSWLYWHGSDLASRQAEHPAIMVAGFLCMGMCLLVASVAVQRSIHGTRLRNLATALMIVAALGIFCSGIAREDCAEGTAACRVLVDAGDVSTQHQLHNLFAIPVLLALAALPFVTGWRMRHDPEWRKFARISFAAGAATVAGIIAFGSEVFEWNGIVQLLLIATAFGWIAAVSLRAYFLEIARSEADMPFDSESRTLSLGPNPSGG